MYESIIFALIVGGLFYLCITASVIREKLEELTELLRKD